MKLARSFLAGVALLVAASGASAAPTLHDIDSDFSILSYSAPFTDPTTYTIVAQNISANNYTNVQFVIPFHYEIDVLPPSTTTATAFTWNNGAQQWEDGSRSIAITGASSTLGLVNMSDTDILTSYTLTPPGTVATVGATDSVPIVDIGNVPSGGTFTFTLNVDFAPDPIKSLGVGFFVVPVPEPASLSLLGLGALGLLARRRRI